MPSPSVRLLRGAGLAAVALGLCLSSTIAGQTPPPAESTGLRPGDAVRIAVWRSSELSGEFEIAGDGTIAHPLYRSVVAVGVPSPVLEQRVRARLIEFEANPQFVVEPLYRVAVGGEVRQPNLYSLRPEVTVLQAVARAGGLSERGRLDRVYLVRDGTRRTLDLVDPQANEADLRIRSGDQIYVQRRREVFREVVAPVASVVAAVASVYRALR